MAMLDGGEYALSLCGNLTEPCIDALTKVQLFGSVYDYFGTPPKLVTHTVMHKFFILCLTRASLTVLLGPLGYVD
jgi:hypothetical protein